MRIGVDHGISIDLMGRRLYSLDAGELVVINLDQVLRRVVVVDGVGAEVAQEHEGVGAIAALKSTWMRKEVIAGPTNRTTYELGVILIPRGTTSE